LLTLHFQTELTTNTHVTTPETPHDIVNTNTTISEPEHNGTSTQIEVSDIHRTVVNGQEGGDGNNPLVSDKGTTSTTE